LLRYPDAAYNFPNAKQHKPRILPTVDVDKKEANAVTPYAYTVGSTAHFQWNLDSSVGKGGQNSSPCDISYIQWYYTLAGRNSLTPPDRQAIYQKVRVTGSCTGRDDDPLVAAIIAHQKALGHPQVDGRVSVAKGGGKFHMNAYFVLRLGARLADMYPNAWPRLDQIPGCPALVAQAVRQAIPRVRQ
jgi:hypothetical protein